MGRGSYDGPSRRLRHVQDHLWHRVGTPPAELHCTEPQECPCHDRPSSRPSRLKPHAPHPGLAKCLPQSGELPPRTELYYTEPRMSSQQKRCGGAEGKCSSPSTDRRTELHSTEPRGVLGICRCAGLSRATCSRVSGCRQAGTRLSLTPQTLHAELYCTEPREGLHCVR